MKRHYSFIVAALLLLSSVSPFIANAATPAIAGSDTEAVASAECKGESKDLKKLRGQLLSKRNKIRRLEKNAMQSDSQLREKITALQNQRKSLFCAANSELTSLYAEEESMQAEIDSLASKKK